MSTRQKIAIIFPLILIASMYPVFQLLSATLGETIGWYLGLVIYWLVNNVLAIGQQYLINTQAARHPEPKKVATKRSA